MIGQTLSHYRILSEISRGGMGIVYRALDLKLDREVALKVLPPELVADPDRKRRFIQEAQAAAKLEHPHIGVVHEIDEAEGVTFIAMELIEGEKLRDIINKERLPLTRALELATEVAEGLALGHDKGIVHRDLKPANIMITGQGHAKIIDFGLAKLLEPLAGEGSDVETALRGQTDPGKVMGTVSYMSPEQARGRKLDHRTDIFTFGIVLHEMLTGRPAFQGPTGADTVNAILTSSAPRLPALGSEVPEQAASELQRILDKCMAKGPEDRYQWMKDLVVDLRAVRRRLESGSITPVALPFRVRRWRYAALAATGALLAILAFMFLLPPSSREEPPLSSAKPSIAILYFENVTGDPELEWLRTGLTDMLVTDLSQSPNLDILSTDRLYQILMDMDRLDERAHSLETVQGIAEAAGAETAVLGSFLKAGDSIRINIRVQVARSGKILATEKVEGLGESSIFPMVDELTRRIKAKLDVSPAIQASPIESEDEDLEDVTTSSIEAYRLYIEAVRLDDAGKTVESIPLFEKAIQLDPDFAMALVSLSIAHWKLGQEEDYESYARQAFEKADRLTLRERLYIEGTYYTLREETFARGIAAFQKSTQLYPHYTASRNDLGWSYRALERYEEAIEQFNILRRDQTRFGGTYLMLAGCYAALGRFEEGYEVLRELISRQPDNVTGHFGLGVHLVLWGKLDEALAALDRAETVRAQTLRIDALRWSIRVLRENWEEADAIAQEMAGSEERYWKRWGLHALALTELYRGRSGEALTLLESSAGAHPGTMYSGDTHAYAAHVLVEKGRGREAQEHAQKAQLEGEGNSPEWAGLYYDGLARARMGRTEEAETTAQKLRERTESIPSRKEERRHHHLLGEIALGGGELAKALEELQRAESLLPARGISSPGSHVPIWFSLASAYLAAAEPDQAAQWFERIIDTGVERVHWPIAYVRSFYFLGKIHENRGEKEKAREYYRRFYEYWKDGDMDRERVEEAKNKLGQT